MCHFKYRQVPLICAHRHTHAHTQTHTSQYTDTPTHTTTHTAVSCCVCVLSCSAVSDSFVTPWTVASRLLCPCNFPGKNTGAGCHFLLQGIFSAQGSNLHLLHWQVYSLSLCHLESPLCDGQFCLGLIYIHYYV